MIGKRYSAQYKIQIVEAYLTENEKNKISIAQFAHNNGISDSTFNDWVVKYRRQGKAFCNVTNEIIKLEELEVEDYEPKPKIVEGKLLELTNPKRCRIYYNEAIVEFDEKYLERVLKIFNSTKCKSK